jgi:hypothetical protein
LPAAAHASAIALDRDVARASANRIARRHVDRAP